MEPTEHLFRRESGRMISALTRLFGVQNLALAEDVVQDALCRALEVWKFQGVPDNPGAWLMQTAKRRAIDVVRRERTRREFAPDVGRLLETEWTLNQVVDEAFLEHELRDEQLRMMFSCCQPALPAEAQIGLILNVLCGFGTSEIAGAFLITEAAAEKRVQRAKRALSESRALFELGASDLTSRLDAVQRALYLLFNEGYHGAHPEIAVREDLCEEALRLALLLAQHPVTARPETLALVALMCLHAARLPGRLDALGGLSTLHEQDRSRWDRRLIEQGMTLLDRSATGDLVTPYHVEAAIAAEHALATSLERTNWTRIVELYDALYAMAPSPVIALNRAIAIGERDGAQEGLSALRALGGERHLAGYPFFPGAMGTLELRLGHQERAREHFQAAAGLSRNPAERAFWEGRARGRGGVGGGR